MGSKTQLDVPAEAKRRWIEPAQTQISLARQCGLVGVPRFSVDDRAVGERSATLPLRRLWDEPDTRPPLYGVRRLTAWLKPQGEAVNPPRVARRLRVLGGGGHLSQAAPSRLTPGHRIDPSLLRGWSIRRVNHVWRTDITSLRLRAGCIDWSRCWSGLSRYVGSGAVSITRAVGCCVEAVERALEGGQPEIWHSDQGAQFSRRDFTRRAEAAGMQSSRDGRGRALDNILVERRWRSVTDEAVSVNDDETPNVAVIGLRQDFAFDHHQRLHQALGYQTPAAVDGGGPQRALGFHEPGKPPGWRHRLVS